MAKISVTYSTSSDFKKEEWRAISNHFALDDRLGGSVHVNDLFEIDFRTATLREPLLCDLKSVVREKAMSAYEVLRVPCIVEHAGLIFEDLAKYSYPGGLTQPMWDALGAERFVRMKGIAGTRVIARAIVGYCDGMTIHLFQGETQGVIAERPRGSRDFYWDNIFCPDGGGDRTYSEIADEPDGVVAKMRLSQSGKAMMGFLTYRLAHEPRLFS
jgi:XTP/dITP diphosphohydrolase